MKCTSMMYNVTADRKVVEFPVGRQLNERGRGHEAA